MKRRDVIYVKLDIVYSINHQLNETISRKSYFFETVKSKVIISLFETVRLSVLISPRNLYNSLKSIKEKPIFREEFEIAVAAMKRGNSAGIDNIAAELAQAGGQTKVDVLTKMCNKIWKTGERPAPWPQPLIITSLKRQHTALPGPSCSKHC